ncbi:MAG: SCO family protein [Chthoniobacterales bacterium]
MEDTSPQGPRIPRLGWAIAFIVFVMVVAVAFQKMKHTTVAQGKPLDKLATVPEFVLTDQTGNKVSLQDLKGKVWVANFIFTQCKGPCPVITSRMAELNQELGNKHQDVKLISFSVDPENDTPEVLAAYGKTVSADPKNWKFLTGSQEDINKVVIKGLLQPLMKDPDGTPAHSTRFVVVDRDGVVRAFEDALGQESVQKLLLNIGALLREPVAVNSEKGQTPK